MSERRELVGDARAWTLQDVADTLGVGLLTLDRQLVVTAWSEWLERVSGKPAFDVVGRHIAEVEPGLGAGERAALEQAVNGATVVLSQPLHKYLLAFPAPGGYPGFSHMQQSVRLVPSATPTEHHRVQSPSSTTSPSTWRARRSCARPCSPRRTPIAPSRSFSPP